MMKQTMLSKVANVARRSWLQRASMVSLSFKYVLVMPSSSSLSPFLTHSIPPHPLPSPSFLGLISLALKHNEPPQMYDAPGLPALRLYRPPALLNLTLRWFCPRNAVWVDVHTQLRSAHSRERQRKVSLGKGLVIV